MRYLSRWLEGDLGARRTRKKVRLVFGARQTGKSTLLSHVVDPDAVIINLQDPRERVRYERRRGELVRRLEALGRASRHVLIDEIQKVPRLLDELQYLVDRPRSRLEFFVTGSSARRLRTTSANLLPGRSHLFDLFPLIASERKQAATSRILPLGLPAETRAGFHAARLDEVLLFGDLPGITQEPVTTRRASLQAYTELYLQEEIRQEALVKDVGAFAAFLEVAARESGGIVNLAQLSRATGIPASTLKVHYQVLVDTFVGYWIPVFGSGGRRKVQIAPRFVFFDQGVRNAAAGWRLDRSLLDHQGPALLEQRVQTELYRRRRYLGRGYRVSYWRTYHGREVDVVVETPKEVIPIEVKWTENPDPHDARHLEAFLDQYAPKATRGFIVCRSPHPLQISRRVTAIPWDEI